MFLHNIELGNVIFNSLSSFLTDLTAKSPSCTLNSNTPGIFKLEKTTINSFTFAVLEIFGNWS